MDRCSDAKLGTWPGSAKKKKEHLNPTGRNPNDKSHLPHCSYHNPTNPSIALYAAEATQLRPSSWTSIAGLYLNSIQVSQPIHLPARVDLPPTIMPEDTTLVVISTSVVALLTGFLLGIYSIQGYIITPEFAKQSRANYDDPVDSDETDIDEEETHLDHAPNWANGKEADRKQGLRYTGNEKPKKDSNKSKAGFVPSVEDTGEECKLILVVRTDLGMTKGKRVDRPTGPAPLQKTKKNHTDANQLPRRLQARSQRSAATRPSRASSPSPRRRAPPGPAAPRRGSCSAGSGTARPRSPCRPRTPTRCRSSWPRRARWASPPR